MHPVLQKYLLLLVMLFCGWQQVFAQSLDNLGEKDPLKVNGGINITTMAYHANGISSRREPFTWFLTGNLNFSFYGWSVPFSFSYSDQNKSFRQPFNRLSLAPEYKWAKVYVGYHNLTYSSYTLAGHGFSGGAVELRPGKFRFQAMYGRLNKAIEEDSTKGISPMYKRMGYGMKLGYGDEQNALELILFRAADDENSLSKPVTDPEIRPEENLVISVVGKKQITSRLGVQMEYASSAYTRDTREGETSTSNLVGKVRPLFTSRASSQYFHAFNTSLGYTGNSYSLQLNYERIGPGYRTLGAYYFNNDMENITVSGSLQLLDNQLTVSANVGQQRNNLEDTETSATKRVVSSVNLGYVPGPKWNFNASYSNFTSYTRVRPRFDPFFEDELDSLNFYQINQNANFSVGHNFGGDQVKQSLFFNSSFQMSKDENDGERSGNQSQMYSGSLAYRINLVPQHMGFTASMNGYRSEMAGNRSLTLGPNLGVNRSFFKKALRSSLFASYNYQKNNENPAGKVMTVRYRAAFAPGRKKKEKEEKKGGLLNPGKHNLSLNVNWLKKMSEDAKRQNFDEWTMTLNYNYSF
ncbi:hypothetical protein AAG747_28420 [Rapidithrix thailandica]|uniref:Uncharacterized protein n=1 Tax=Rapidithrix thailandica TaxID=413964 RepID=A0AAW9S9Q0_9BACT